MIKGVPMIVLVAVSTTETFAVPVWGARISATMGRTCPAVKVWMSAVFTSAN